jgi:hypothetical protein
VIRIGLLLGDVREIVLIDETEFLLNPLSVLWLDPVESIAHRFHRIRPSVFPEF